MTRNVHPLFPGEDRFTNRVTSNNSYGPHTADDYGYQHGDPAPQWQWRDGDGRIPRPEFPALKSQAEIDAEEFEFSPLAYLVMFSAAASVALIIAGFNWIVGAW